MELVAFIGKDKENWGQVKGVMNNLECERIVLIQDETVSDFPIDERTEIVKVDCGKPLLELKEEILNAVKPKLSGDFEVSLSIASGSGKEHMALISALLCVPVGIRLVVFTKKGIEVLN